jgi:hypothetical protein
MVADLWASICCTTLIPRTAHECRWGLDAINGGKPFRAVLRELDLTPNQVWALTKTDAEWATALEAALMATRREDLEHGTKRRIHRWLRVQGAPRAPANPDG